jgi:hypothetical protein
LARKRIAVEDAFIKLRNLMFSLRRVIAAPSGIRTESEDKSLVYFFQGSLGGMRLDKKDAAIRDECIHAFVHARNPGGMLDTAPLSRGTVEQLLNDTLLRSLRPIRSNDRNAFGRRVRRLISKLRKAVTGQPSKWIVYVQVRGIQRGRRPFEYGRIKFVDATPRAVRRLATEVIHHPEFQGRKLTAATIARKRKAHRSLVASFISGFTGHAFAQVTVDAVDHNAAESIGLDEIRRTIDILNFFARVFEPIVPSRAPYLYLVPAGRNGQLNYAVRSAEPGTNHWGAHLFGRPGLAMPLEGGTKAAKSALVRAHRLLRKVQRTDLDARIMAALSWAGRASVEHRRDQAFLLFAISLEALLSDPERRTGVTDRLRFRIAHLIGRDVAGRKTLLGIVDELYNQRSRIVHSGDSRGVTESGLKQLCSLCQLTLAIVLRRRQFARMQTGRDFDAWFDDRLLAGR